MAMLISLDTIEDEELSPLLKAGGLILTLEGKRYLRIDEVAYNEATTEDEDEDEC